jgi:hypothetical protein
MEERQEVNEWTGYFKKRMTDKRFDQYFPILWCVSKYANIYEFTSCHVTSYGDGFFMVKIMEYSFPFTQEEVDEYIYIYMERIK